MKLRFGSTGVLALLSMLLLTPLLWAAEAITPPTQTITLQPASVPELRIDFNYNFQKALPPFDKEPTAPGQELARGLIPTVPPTPLLRNINKNELYLNLDHNGDFIGGKLATYRSTYNGHVFFRDLRVWTSRGDLEIPYTLDLFTYEHGCAGWLCVRSGWEGRFEVAGQPWRLSVVDNLNGQIGAEDTLYLTPPHGDKPPRQMAINPIPRTLFVEGQAFDLDLAFEHGPTGVVVRASLQATNLPLGKLTLAAQGCSFIRLTSDRVAAVLDRTTGTVSIPAGSYHVSDCLLDVDPRKWPQPTFIRLDKTVEVKLDTDVALALGLPLQNTLQVVRDANVLRLTYQVLGQGGEQYEYYNWKDRPRFSVYKGPIKIGSGSLPFG